MKFLPYLLVALLAPALLFAGGVSNPSGGSATAIQDTTDPTKLRTFNVSAQPTATTTTYTASSTNFHEPNVKTVVVGTDVSAPAASIALTVPAGYRELEISLSGRGDTAAAAVGVRMQFNADTSSNYSYNLRYVTSAAATGDDGASASAAFIGAGSINAASASAGRQGSYCYRIPNYAGTTLEKAVLIHGSYYTSGAVTNTGSGQWASTTAITSVLIYPATGNFATGTTVTVIAR